MPLPRIDKANRDKPLCYDPNRKKFITYDEIIAGTERIHPVDALSDADFQELVIERQRRGPAYRVQAMSGPPLSREDVIRSIERNEPFGRMTKDAERSALRDLLRQIDENLKK